MTNCSQLPKIPRLDDFPKILEKANRLARIDRYLSSLEEFSSFFLSVKQHYDEQLNSESDKELAMQYRNSRGRAILEASRVQNKILHEQRLCRTYMKQFDALVQLVSLKSPL